jgi:hypothetical protein
MVTTGFADLRFRAKKEHPMSQAQFLVIREAIDVVLRQLDCLPPSDTREQLRERIRNCAQDAEMWSASWRTPREMDVLMKRVLAMRVEVTKLDDGAAVRMGEAVGD